MRNFAVLCAIAIFPSALTSWAQESPRPSAKIDSDLRTLTISGSETVTVEPDLAILHVGFDTPSEDAKSAYADGARTSNVIIAAIKQAGIPETAIRSESQYMERDWEKPHRFKLAQQWTVKVPPARAAEILDIAVTAGATSSGQIEWTVKDEKALENEALEHAAARARENAAVLAKGMEVRLGMLISVSNQVSTPVFPRQQMNVLAAAKMAPQLSVEPHQVSREATVYAVFAIE